MADKKTYYIDEGALRQKLLSYSVSFNLEAVAALENEISHIKTRAPFELPERKMLVKFVAIPLIVVAFGVVVYFGFTYIKDLAASSSSKKDSTTVVKPAVEPKIEVKQKEDVKTLHGGIPPMVKNTDTLKTVVKPEIKKTETTTKVETKTKTKPQPEKDTTTPSPSERAGVRSDTTSPLRGDSGGLAPPDSSTKNKDGVPKKKKKKKKNTDVTEDIRQQNQQPNATDDDVVVPTGN